MTPHKLTVTVTPNSRCIRVMSTVPLKPNTVIGTLLLPENTPFTSSPPRSVEDAVIPKENGLVQGRRVIFMTTGMRELVVNVQYKVRQSSEIVQSPELAWDKVWFLRLLREVHIWDCVAFWGQVESSSGGDGKEEGITGDAVWEGA